MPRIPANQIQLYYEMAGQGPPLVFIHGLGSSTRDWEAQVPAFSDTYRVITFDLRGHGQSDKPPGPYTIPQFAADTAALLKALAATPAHIVGVSLGGGVAFQFALDYPELVRTLTIVNSSPAMAGSREDIQREMDRRSAIVRQMGMRAMGEALSPNLFPQPAHEALRQAFVERWAANDPDAYLAALLSMADWDVQDQIGAIRCPTLILAAEHDYAPVALKEAYMRRMPNAELVVIPGAHHAVPMEDPEHFNAALAAFLSQHS